MAATKQANAGISNGDDAKRCERIVQRYVHRGTTFIVQRQPRFPQQQGVEQFARRLASATTTVGERLAAIVAFTHHLHGCGRAVHLDTARVHHGLKQFPGIIRQQFQQTFIHGGDGNFTGFRRSPAGALRHLYRYAGLVPYLVSLFVGADLYAEFVRLPANADFRHAHLERRFSEIHQRRGLNIGNAPAHHQHRNEHVRRITAFQRNIDHRSVAGQRLHERIDDAFALHRHQRSGLAEGHAHLELRRLPRLIAPALGNQVHAVVVVLVEPPSLVASHPGGSVGIGQVAFPVLGARAHDDVARKRRLQVAEQTAFVVGLAVAADIELFDFRAVLVTIETSDQALAVAVAVARV